MSDWNYRNASMKKAHGQGVGCATIVFTIIIAVAAAVAIFI